ncbi:hypothetical protein BT96DRAFT_118820 [Gymnopus androsaceus JB14]|uniref:Uncharacterized protein n=1 Tax=Gymnopus androsaceus JB14 TaxID=1447944 RepID=A0A6A4HG90_9AGAR|nr:hypothetical protein BT96DRAFT_118820 [Gymnopus androsaceus JB14]
MCRPCGPRPGASSPPFVTARRHHRLSSCCISSVHFFIFLNDSHVTLFLSITSYHTSLLMTLRAFLLFPLTGIQYSLLLYHNRFHCYMFYPLTYEPCTYEHYNTYF